MNYDQSYHQSWATAVSSKPLRGHWKSMTALAAWFTALGLSVIVFSTDETTPISGLIGTVLVLAGAAQSTQSMVLKNWHGFITTFALGMTCATIGALNLLYPIQGVGIAALLLIGFLALSTVIKLILTAQLYPARGWGPITTSAGVSSFFVVLLMVLEVSVPWALGFMLGVDLIFNAWWMLMLVLISRRY